MKNMTQVISSDKYLSTLNRGVIAASLVGKLNGAGPFTIFAPTDLAFGKLATGVFSKLVKKENQTELINLLNHHIIIGKTIFEDLKNGQKLKTLSGKELDVTVKEGKVSINGANVQAKDIEGSNGVLHSIDKVIYLS